MRGLAVIAFCATAFFCGEEQRAAAADAPALPPLTTVKGNPRLPGKFIWADLVTDNVPAAQKFYQGLFGWSFRGAGGYLIAYNEERPVAGMFQKARPEGRPARPRWFGYISTKDVTRARERVLKMGGRVLAPPQKFPDRGEQAVFADPEGAVFGAIKSSAGDPEDSLAEPGDWIWIQLLSRDAQKAAEFYRAVAGYEVMLNTQSNRISDYVLASEGFARGTVRTIPEKNTDVQPTWLPFVRVKEIGVAVAKARELGGSVSVEPKPEVLEGKVAVVVDPTGAAVGLLEWSSGLLSGGTR